MHRVSIGMLMIACLLITACDPFKEQREAAAERKRIECMDKLCAGDVEPKRNPAMEVALKLNGQWYLGPSYYFSTGMNGAAFYWPSKKSREDVPPEERSIPYANTIEIHLTGRSHWSHSDESEPWRRDHLTERLDQLRGQGYQLQRELLRPELEVWRVRRSDGSPYMDFYVANQQKRIRGGTPPALGCSEDRGSSGRNTCAAGEYWQPDVYADFRFSAAHAKDWPEIHAEIVRVLNLLIKVKP